MLGFDELAGYLGKQPSFGALIGRYGNRIAHGRFVLEGTEYRLPTNWNGHTLHGGPEGFSSRIWRADTGSAEGEASVRLQRVSPDGEMGFPGTLTVNCTYSWSDNNELRIHYTATTDRPTVVNLTNHSYFRLGDAPTVLDHLLRIAADRYTPTDREQVPLGTIEPVADSPLDFRTEKQVGRDIAADHPQIELAGGYDHNYVVNDYNGELREIATVRSPTSGITLRCLTTEPGVQLFTANFAPGEFRMRGDTPVPVHGGICLETQHFPDAVNHEAFTTPLLRPGERYDTTTVYRFEV